MKMAGAVLVLLAALGIGFQNAARIRKSYEELVYLKKIMIMLRGGDFLSDILYGRNLYPYGRTYKRTI